MILLVSSMEDGQKKARVSVDVAEPEPAPGLYKNVKLTINRNGEGEGGKPLTVFVTAKDSPQFAANEDAIKE